jgi:hypothetical protein
MKTIEYYVREVYGNKLEYVLQPFDAALIAKLTGKKTIGPDTRGLITALSNGEIQFKQVLKP